MKFKISFEIDAVGTSYAVKNKNDSVKEVLQNLSMIFSQMKSDILLRKSEILSSDCIKEQKDALIGDYNEKLKLT